MCRCDERIKSPWCGRGECKPPPQRASFSAAHRALLEGYRRHPMLADADREAIAAALDRLENLSRERDAWKQAAVRVYREGWECESDVDALAVLRGRFGIVSE